MTPQPTPTDLCAHLYPSGAPCRATRGNHHLTTYGPLYHEFVESVPPPEPESKTLAVFRGQEGSPSRVPTELEASTREQIEKAVYDYDHHPSIKRHDLVATLANIFDAVTVTPPEDAIERLVRDEVEQAEKRADQRVWDRLRSSGFVGGLSQKGRNRLQELIMGQS